MVRIGFEDTRLDFDPIPDGEYHVVITGGEERETGENSKTPNSPYWNIELTVQDGPEQGRKDWVNVMLPPYELFTLGNILLATGRFTKEQLKAGEYDVELYETDLEKPNAKDSVALVGQELLVSVKTRTKKGSDQPNRNHRFSVYDPEAWDATEGVSLAA